MVISKYQEEEREFIAKTNLKFKSDIEKILKNNGKITRFTDYLKYQGLDSRFASNENSHKSICFKKPIQDDIYRFENVLESLMNLPYDYTNDFKKLHTKNHRHNPFRIEVSLEKESAKPGTISYSFGKWIQLPYWTENIKIFNGVRLPFRSCMPKYAFVAFRPEKIEEGKEAIKNLSVEPMNNKPTGFKPMHIRIANDFNNQNSGSLVISKYETNGFKFLSLDKNRALKKWDFLVPGLKEHCDHYYRD